MFEWEWIKIAVNAATFVAWVLGIAITAVAVAKGKKMRDEMGVSIRVYLSLAGITEVVYTIGALMILSAMGINVMQHLANLEFQQVYTLLSKFDLSTIQIVGVVGWMGFVINRTVSFLSPGYLLIAGGKKLHPYFRRSAWLEVCLEIVTTVLVFISLKWG